MNRRREASSVAIPWARNWAHRLVELHGMPASSAAALAAKRYGLDARDVFVPHQLAPAWRNGSLERPTARPRVAAEDVSR